MKIFWIPFIRNKAVKLLELGWHNQFDYFFLRIFLWEFRFTKKW